MEDEKQFPRAAFAVAVQSGLSLWLLGLSTKFAPGSAISFVMILDAMAFAASVALVFRGAA